MYLKFFLFLCTLGLVISCKPNASNSGSGSNVEQTTESNTRTEALPAPTADFMEKLKSQTEGIDYMFRNTNFSISQSDAASIGTTVAMMGTEKPVFMDKKCNSPIRITYIGAEGIICDTEMYIDPTCMYQVYYLNNKPTYSAKMTQTAFTYLNNLINQAANVQQR